MTAAELATTLVAIIDKYEGKMVDERQMLNPILQLLTVIARTQIALLLILEEERTCRG